MSRLAEYLEAEPARKRAAAEAQKAKLEALEKKLGLTPSSSSAADEESRASTSKNDGGVPEPLAGKKHRFDDTEYLEQSREIVDGVKNAVTAGEDLAAPLSLIFNSFVYASGRFTEKTQESKKEPPARVNTKLRRADDDSEDIKRIAHNCRIDCFRRTNNRGHR